MLHLIIKKESKLEISGNLSYFMLKGVDLKNINQLTFCYASQGREAAVEVHVDSLTGPIISSLNYPATKDWKTFEEVTAAIKDPGGVHDLFFLFKEQDAPNEVLCLLDWIRFRQ